MFKHTEKRYMTKSIQVNLHEEIIHILWTLIDWERKKNVSLDYLQIFELNVREGQQLVIHRQEKPLQRKEWVIFLQYAKPIKGKVWCIDNEGEQVMLFPKDY